MTKRKSNRQKHQKDVSFDTSDEEFYDPNIQGKHCPHVTKGVHFGRVKKSLKASESILNCNGCSNDKVDETPEVWLCLQCGYKGCGRTSENKHALQHFKIIHSDCHAVVLSTTSGFLWCYDCDDQVSLQSSHILKQCVEFVMKTATTNSSNKSVNKSPAQESLQNTVIQEETSVQEHEDIQPIEKNKPVKSSKEVSQKVIIKGLKNLGNTCFFNAVMQNLNQTSLLHHELKNTCTPSHPWEVPELVFSNNEITENGDAENLKLSLPRQFPLTNSLSNFFEQMQAVSSAKVDCVNPSSLFGEISKKCPQFRHFQQQDSHELLRQLMDGVRQEEIKRQKKAILKYFELENVSPENVDDEMKKKFKAYGCHASHTIIEKVFGGLLISTVLCEECKVSSQVFEPFMDLSLPLFEEKPLRNRKSVDLEDNDHGEYILSKPKNDPSKPSKHQEKKQKQFAKREKKRTKTARNRKNSQTEFDDNTNAQLPETTDAINDEDKDSAEDEPDLSHNQSNENFNESDVTKPTDENSEELKATAVDLNENSEELKATAVDLNENSKELKATAVGLNENSEELKTTAVGLNENSEELKATTVGLNENSEELKATVVGLTENCEKTALIESCKIIPDIAEVSHLELTPDIHYHIQEDDEKVVNLIEPEKMQINWDYKFKEVLEESGETSSEMKDEENTYKENLDAVELSKPLAEVDQHSDKDEEFENQNEVIINHEVSLDDTIDTLTSDFTNSLGLSESKQSNLDDRIQALTMQITDVRIRRDSDRQENILSSSESAEEYESQKTNCTSPKSSIEDTCSLENGDGNWTHSVSEQQTKEWILKSLTTLKPRLHVSGLECSINSCLSHFTKPELLTGNNKFRCENCTELKVKKTGNKKDVAYSNASKQMLIFSPPAVLTLHLKRFQQVGMSLRKVNRFVEFPLVLDLAPFCSSACVILPHMTSVVDEILYSLYGIVEHIGRLTSGHYTAYVKANKRTINRTFECQLPLAQCNLEQLLHKFSGADCSSFGAPETSDEERRWYNISDTHVKEVSESQVLKCQAYLLFYERIK